jgi:hypothetical protein
VSPLPAPSWAKGIDCRAQRQILVRLQGFVKLVDVTTENCHDHIQSHWQMRSDRRKSIRSRTWGPWEKVWHSGEFLHNDSCGDQAVKCSHEEIRVCSTQLDPVGLHSTA